MRWHDVFAVAVRTGCIPHQQAVAGGITSIPAAMAVFAVARRPVFFAYVGFAVLGSLAPGLAYGLLA